MHFGQTAFGIGIRDGIISIATRLRIGQQINNGSNPDCGKKSIHSLKGRSLFKGPTPPPSQYTLLNLPLE